MSAYVAIQSFSTIAPDGAPVVVPLGARVEQGDHYYNAYPEAFVPEGECSYFGRVNPANGLQETTQAPPLLETKTEPGPPAPEASIPVPAPAPEAKTQGSGPRSSIGRKTLPTK